MSHPPLSRWLVGIVALSVSGCSAQRPIVLRCPRPIGLSITPPPTPAYFEVPKALIGSEVRAVIGEALDNLETLGESYPHQRLRGRLGVTPIRVADFWLYYNGVEPWADDVVLGAAQDSWPEPCVAVSDLKGNSGDPMFLLQTFVCVTEATTNERVSFFVSEVWMSTCLIAQRAIRVPDSDGS